MSDTQPQLFPDADVQDVIAKLQAGQVVQALDKVLSNTTVFEIASRRKQITDIQSQITFLQTRATQLQSEIDAILAGNSA